VPDPADHPAVNSRSLEQQPRTPDGRKCRADNVERRAVEQTWRRMARSVTAVKNKKHRAVFQQQVIIVACVTTKPDQPLTFCPRYYLYVIPITYTDIFLLYWQFNEPSVQTF